MVVHTSKKLKKAGQNLVSDKTNKKQKEKASKVLNDHKKKNH